MGKINSQFSRIARFLSGVKQRGGMYVITSGVLVKLISLVISVMVARSLSKTEFGAISYALLIITLTLPFSTGAITKTVLRFGAKCESLIRAEVLYKFYFKLGGIINVFIIAILIALIPFLFVSNEMSIKYFYLLLPLIIIEFLYGMRQTRLRLHENNKAYAVMSFNRGISLLIIVLASMLSIGHFNYVYIIALVFAPLIAFFLTFNRKINLASSPALVDSIFDKVEMNKFAGFVAFSGGISQLQLLVDSILIANLLEEPAQLASYRVASLLPLSFLVITTAFFNSEYVNLVKHHSNKEFIKTYLKNYTLLSVPVTLLLILVAQVGGEFIITLLFGAKYIDSVVLFKILTVGICGSIMLRQPFGILNNVSGRADLNLINSLVSIIITIGLIVWLIPFYGITGAAIGSSIMLWSSGLVNLLLYYCFVYRKAS